MTAKIKMDSSFRWNDDKEFSARERETERKVVPYPRADSNASGKLCTLPQ